MKKAIPAIWTNGQIVPTQPVDWPEGTALAVEPIEGQRPPAAGPAGDLLGDDPASIARWLAWFDSLEALEFTPEEEAALQGRHGASDETGRSPDSMRGPSGSSWRTATGSSPRGPSDRLDWFPLGPITQSRA
jgi:hypothetical protein